MTYKSSPTGGMLMMVVVDVSGEIIAHVSDKAGNVHRYDMKIAEQEPTGFIDDVPLDQVGDMGAVFAPADGSHQQSCTIKPGG